MDQNCAQSNVTTLSKIYVPFFAASLTNYPLTAAFILVITLLLIFENYWKKGIQTSTKRANTEERIPGLEFIDGPTPFPVKLIGNLFLFWPYRKTLSNWMELCLAYGSVFKLSYANLDAVVLNSAPAVQALFRATSEPYLAKVPLMYDLLKPFVVNAAVMSTGKFWQQERKILFRSMSFQSLRGYSALLNKHCQRLVSSTEIRFRDGELHPIDDLIHTSFLEVVCEMVTGFDMHGTSEGKDYHPNFNYWKECMAYRFLNPWFIPNVMWRFNPRSKRNDKGIEEMIQFARRRLADHKQRRLEARSVRKEETSGGKDNYYGSPLFRSVLDELVDAGLPEEQIIDEMNGMLIAGHDTGSTAMNFFCFLMSLNPAIQEACRKEVDEAFEDPMQFDGENLSYDSVSGNLQYLERCILETLRLYPPVFVFFRQLKAPLRVVNDNGVLVEIPSGVNLTVSPLALHRNPEYYPNPEEFNPDRFLPEEIKKRPQYSFIPFSAGARNCLGIKFAILEIKMVSAYLLRNFVMSTTDRQEDITLLPNFTLSLERDCNFLFTRRLPTL